MAKCKHKKKRERGDGGLFLVKGSKNYYAQIYKDGRPYRISTGCSVKEEAKEFLRKVQAEASAGKPFIGDVRKVTYSDLRAGLLANYREKGNKSLLVDANGEEFINGLGALDTYFGFSETNSGWPVTKITTDAARAFAAKRLAEGVTNSTVNSSLALLRRMFRIAHKEGKIHVVPVIWFHKANPARKGFVSKDQFDKLVSHLPIHLRPLITFLYWCGVRRGEALQIQWEQVDLEAALIRLEGEQTKSGEARIIPLPDDLVGMLQSVKEKQGQVFDGTNLRKAWAKACVAAGLGQLEPIDKNGNQRYNGLIVHDLRRSAVRNLRKAGVPESVAMKISGHKTRTVFERYNIVDAEDLTDAMRKVQNAATTRPENLIDRRAVSVSSVLVRPSRATPKRLTALLSTTGRSYNR